MLEPRSSRQLSLFQAESEADRYIKFTMVEQANALSRTLSKKRLPMFYFTEAGEELGIPPKTCRSWKINTWPTVNRADDDKLIQKVAIYIRVYMRLKEYPPEESYAEATKRLQERVRYLKEEKKFSHNRISQHLKVSHRTLDILEKAKNEPARLNHCPWALLKKLEGAEEEMQKRQEKQEELRNNRILREGMRITERTINTKPPEERTWVRNGGKCLKCGAPWNNLQEDGKDAWDRTIMTCIICGKENPLAPDEAPDELSEEADEEKPGRGEFLERYDTCRECGAPWHNLKRERVDRWNNTVYICLRCTGINRVKPKQQAKANWTGGKT